MEHDRLKYRSWPWEKNGENSTSYWSSLCICYKKVSASSRSPSQMPAGRISFAGAGIISGATGLQVAIATIVSSTCCPVGVRAAYERGKRSERREVSLSSGCGFLASRCR